MANKYMFPFAIFPTLEQATKNLANLVNLAEDGGIAGVLAGMDGPAFDGITDDDAEYMLAAAVCFIADPTARELMASYGLHLIEAPDGAA